jgi:hypothetical protein
LFAPCVSNGTMESTISSYHKGAATKCFWIATQCVKKCSKEDFQHCCNIIYIWSDIVLWAVWNIRCYSDSKLYTPVVHKTRSPGQRPFAVYMFTLFTLFVPMYQSGRKTSFGRWVWFTESHIVLVTFFLLVLFNHFVLDIKKAYCIQLTKSLSIKITVTCTPSHRSRKRLLSHWTASVRCPLLTFPLLNFSPYKPSYLSPTVPEHTLTD